MEEGVSDFAQYAPNGDEGLVGDFFVPDEVFEQVKTKVLRSYG